MIFPCLPLPEVLRLVFIMSPSREFVKYWQEVGCQRGYTFELFKEISEAKAWLIKQVK
jgi:hypothetical protein